MKALTDQVEQHYARDGILEAIRGALQAMGKDPTCLTPIDLAPVDEFHSRGREATIELANRAELVAGLHVLDVGCGLGGSARYLAHEHKCRVTGIDLTEQYVEVARTLAQWVGLNDVVEFRHCSALDMPFADSTFDAVWTEHVQMNISNKRAFYAEITRVLKPGGRLLFHDIFQGDGGEPHYPVPWAEDASISFLAPPQTVHGILGKLGLTILDWEDRSAYSLQWFEAAMGKMRSSGPPPLGLHLLAGGDARAKFENLARNLRESRIVVLQAVAEKA
jgi:SAM-dependent methyltransferase